MALRTRNILSLCAGVGGLELGILLALDYLGEAGRGVCYVEREAGAAASLVASMEAGWLHPAPVWSDMLTFDARRWRGVVHILASGDPCQDNSVAGKQAGAEGARFLAPEVCRIAAECRPDLIFRENVPGNADGQLEAIVPALEGLGYRVAAGIFSSAETGNTMRRERLFIMGSSLRSSGGRLEDDARRGAVERTSIDRTSGGGSIEMVEPESLGSGESGAEYARQQGGYSPPSANCALGRPGSAEPQGQQRGQHYTRGWQVKGGHTVVSSGTVLPPVVIPGPTDSRWLDVLDRFPELQPAISKEEAESHLRRGIDAVAHRVERLRATGNGVDPVVAAHAFLSLSALLAEGR